MIQILFSCEAVAHKPFWVFREWIMQVICLALKVTKLQSLMLGVTDITRNPL